MASSGGHNRALACSVQRAGMCSTGICCPVAAGLQRASGQLEGARRGLSRLTQELRAGGLQQRLNRHPLRSPPSPSNTWACICNKGSVWSTIQSKAHCPPMLLLAGRARRTAGGGHPTAPGSRSLSSRCLPSSAAAHMGPNSGSQCSLGVAQLLCMSTQVNAAVGCLARIPLPQGALRPLRMRRGASRQPASRPAQKKSAPAPPARPAGLRAFLSALCSLHLHNNNQQPGQSRPVAAKC